MGLFTDKLRGFFRTRVGRLTLAAGVAMAATAGVVSLESNRRVMGHQLLALRIAQQSAAQAEALVLSARQNQERDPIGWALSRLAQGGDARVIRVTRARVPSEAPAESGEWNDDTGTLAFRKRLPSEDGESGGNWWVQVGFLGFLGARSRFASELGALLVFALFCTIVYRSLRPTEAASAASPGSLLEDAGPSLQVSASPSVPAALPPAFDLQRVQAQHAADFAAVQNALDPKLEGAQAGFVRVTAQVRDLLKRVQQFALRARAAGGELEALRQEEHRKVREIHEARTWIAAASQGGGELEASLKRLQLELARQGVLNPAVERFIQGAIQFAAAHRTRLVSCQAVVGRLESVLEPRTMDLDLVSRHFQDALTELGKACASVQPTTEALIAQAKTLEELELAIQAELSEKVARLSSAEASSQVA